MTMPNSSRILCWDIIAPPCPLNGTTAEDIFAALHRHPSVKRLTARIAELQQLAAIKVYSFEFDGASPNDRLFAHFSNDPRYKVAGCMYQHSLCQNHQQHLGSVTLVSAIDLNLISNMFCSSMFLGNNGHWRRLLHAVRPVVESRLRIDFSPSPPEAQGYGELYRDIVLRYARTHDDRCSGKSQAGRQMEAHLEEFLSVFNGAWWSREWVHHCRSDRGGFIWELVGWFGLLIDYLFGHSLSYEQMRV